MIKDRKMKWTDLIVFIYLAVQQASTIQAYVISYSKFTFLDPGSEEVYGLQDEAIAKLHQPFYGSISNSYESDHFDNRKKILKGIKIKDKSFEIDYQEDDLDQPNPLHKRELNSHTGAIVPYKPPGAIVVHQGGKVHPALPPKTGYGRGAKIATVATTVAAVGGLTASITTRKRDLAEEEVQFVKRGGRRGAGRTRAARARREANSQANREPEKKGGMGKGKAAMIVAGGAALGAAAVHVAGKGGTGDPNIAPA
ncbi:uncharacterized protein FA14DRAFT_192591 [Meira miltonrushii]|uniref:Uncharacterized protein n=1 Tax=Meira miltonrushii TaxID=1280837 RepID=A0A316V4J8_9BASI|nr:uncharacterized protein FA14DRAFT_192591 [Meira miltonrushii]PWN32382.1 hypothetical protein FA14DRAFT_192591 [Meira miltonrushii]